MEVTTLFTIITWHNESDTYFHFCYRSGYQFAIFSSPFLFSFHIWCSIDEYITYESETLPYKKSHGDAQFYNKSQRFCELEIEVYLLYMNYTDV